MAAEELVVHFLRERILIPLLFVLITCTIDAQSPISLPVNFIDQFKGLHDTRNFFCYQDKEGFIWMSSMAGLHRFDGSHVHTYLPEESDTTSLVGKHVNGFFSEDEAGNIWFATFDAINCYVRKHDNFRSFKRKGTYHRGYYTIGLDSLKQLWMMHQGELVTFHTETKEFTYRYTLMTGVNRAHMVLDSVGHVKSIYAYSTEIRESPGVQIMNMSNPGVIISNVYMNGAGGLPIRVKDIYVSDDDHIWVIGHRGLIKLMVESGDWFLYSPEPRNRQLYFRAIERLDDETLLVATYANGLYTFNTRTEKFNLHYTLIHDDLPLDEPPQAIYKDKNGGIWITIGHRGIAYYHPANLLFRHYRHDLSTPVSSSRIGMNSLLELPDSSVWSSSNKHGAVIFSDASTVMQHYHKHNTPSLEVNSTIMSFLDSRGYVWLLAERGVYIRKPDGKIYPIKDEEKLSYESICELDDGRIILGSRFGGLYYSEPFVDWYTNIEKLNVDADKTFTFLKTLKNGLVYASVNQSQIDIYDPNYGFKLVYSFPFLSEIHCIEENISDTTFWVGSDNGIFCIDPGNNSIEKLKWASCLDGTIVYGLFKTSERQIWTSTNKGIILLDAKNRTCRQFGNSNGLCGTIFSRHCAIQKMDGMLWFGNNYGVTVINPSEVNPRNIQPKVNITDILINDGEERKLECEFTGATNLTEVQALSLPFRDNTVSFQFSSVDYSGTEGTRYEYMLVGEDENWVDAGSRGFARYANLRPGKYQFKARVRNTEDSYEELQFNIVPPIYMRTWFIILAVMLTLLFIVWIIRSIEERKRKIQQLNYERILAIESERMRIANDMHDDLGSSLSAISLRSKVIANDLNDPSLSNQMDRLVQSTTEITQQIRDTIWSLNSKNDKIDTLITRLHDYATSYFEHTPINCSVALMEEKDYSPIPGNVRRAIFLTFKEALHNIYKHSKANKVIIKIYKDQLKNLVISIRDNGNGFDTEQKVVEGNGLASMQNRMESIKGRIELVSDDSGTLVELAYSLNYQVPHNN